MRRNRLSALLGGLAAVALLATACGSDDSDADDTEAPEATVTTPGSADASTTAPAGGGGSITVGSADFTESQLLGEIYAQALEAKGFQVSRQLNIGSREVYYPAIVGNEIQVVPDYTNSLLSFVLRQSDPNALPEATDVDGQIAELATVLPADLKVLTPSAAEDKDTIVCTADVAEEHSLTNLTSLFAVADQITLGAPAEFEGRAPFGLAGFSEQGAEFKSFVPLAFGAIPDALKSGQIDCANMFSTDPAIASNGFVALDDDLKLVPNEAVLPLVRSTVADDPAAVEALDAVSAALTTEGLTDMLQQVSGEAADPAEVAKQFIADNGLG
jgi:osmoprotectant transport system substrate-binding protein